MINQIVDSVSLLPQNVPWKKMCEEGGIAKLEEQCWNSTSITCKPLFVCWKVFVWRTIGLCSPNDRFSYLPARVLLRCDKSYRKVFHDSHYAATINSLIGRFGLLYRYNGWMVEWSMSLLYWRGLFNCNVILFSNWIVQEDGQKVPADSACVRRTAAMQPIWSPYFLNNDEIPTK